ncbi:short-chain dehydrogenase [soil metagenome]
MTKINTDDTLVIGGTGMLLDACKHFAHSEIVYVVSRNELSSDYKNIFHIKADYTNPDEFLKAIKECFKNRVFPQRVILWIHSTGDEAVYLLLNFIFLTHPKTKIFHIKGNGNFNPSKAGKIIVSNINYFEIILGFTLRNDSSRWLTNEEISAGVIEAVKSEKKSFTIGVTEPWDKHP